MAALLVLAPYKELLPFVGLRRLVVINICCSALAVLYSISNCKRLAPFLGSAVILTSVLVSLHQSWTTYAILASFVFDLIGGGETTRIIIVISCIAIISPPEEL